MFVSLNIIGYSMVIATLEKVNPGRRCFRMVGDTLVERNVKEILPAVRQNRDQVGYIYNIQR